MSGRPHLTEVLGRFPVARNVSLDFARAAALAVLRERADDVEVLLIQRTERSNDPASGHVALPGGRVEPADEGLERTALRECEEEVGIGASDLAEPVRFVGVGRAFQSQLPVGVFAAPMAARARPPRPASRAEVAEVFWLPRSTLLPARAVERSTQVGTRTVEATVFEGHVLWGFTRRVLLDLFEMDPPQDGVGAGPQLPHER